MLLEMTSLEKMHPMFVHFPIAFWTLATGAWGYSILRKNEISWKLGLFLHTAGILGAALAILLGFVATNSMGHDAPGHAMVHGHRDLMIIASATALLLTGLAWWQRQGAPYWRFILTFISVLQFGIMSVGCDRGAALVYRYGVGVDPEPPQEEGAHSHGSPLGHHGDDKAGRSHEGTAHGHAH